jgi:hypothetical protein
MLRILSSVLIFSGMIACGILAEDEPLTLSIKTLDGLIVFSGEAEEIRKFDQEIKERFHTPLTMDETIAGLREIGKAPERMELYFSAEGEQRKIEHKVQKMTLGTAVREGLIPNLLNREMYEAYTLLKSEGIDMRILGDSPLRGVALNASVFIHSSMLGSQPSRIFVNGLDYSSGAIGYNLVVLSPDGEEVVAKAGFETYRDPEQGEKMENFLRAQPEGALLLGEVFLGPGVFLTSGAIKAFEGYGLTANINPELSTSHAFIGKKGLAPGTALEQTAPNLDSEIVLFAKNIYINEKDLEALASDAGGFTVALSGTAPSDTVYLITTE